MSKRASREGAGPDGSGEAASLPASLDADETPALAAESIGAYLSQQRRLRSITVDQLAELTRIPKRSIERLEAGHFDDDVDGFVRGFVRTVASGLGLDPEDTLSRMLAEPRVDAGGDRGMSVLVGRSLVGLAAVALLALAFGVVRAVWQAGESAGPSEGAEVVVWRSDPVRALAEAHAAGGPLEAPAATRVVTPEPQAAPTLTTE